MRVGSAEKVFKVRGQKSGLQRDFCTGGIVSVVWQRGLLVLNMDVFCNGSLCVGIGRHQEIT